MPHRNLTMEQLEALMQKRQRLQVIMYTSEAVVAAMLFVWAIQLLQIKPWQYDPISAALRQFTPLVSPKVHGALLLLVCGFHGYLMVYSVPGWRRHCIMAEMAFLFFVEYNLIFAYLRTHLFIPGLYGVPVLILFSIINSISLVKPKIPQEPGKCPTDN